MLSRDFPHGSGVGSTGRVGSPPGGGSWASSVITADSGPVDCRTCLPHPDCLGRPGNMLIITITATFVGLSRQTREHAHHHDYGNVCRTVSADPGTCPSDACVRTGATSDPMRSRVDAA